MIKEYENSNGVLFRADVIEFLESIETESVDMIFADPPYNIGKAKWDYFKSQGDYLEWSEKWIKESTRILKQTGTMYICGFSENLADIKVITNQFFNICRWLIWSYENKANLGKDWGRSHESILCLRKSKQYTMNIDDVRVPYKEHTLKYPSHKQGESSQFSGKRMWTPHPKGAKPKDVIKIPILCNGMKEKTSHPTQKPEELVKTLILASSNKGETIVDPFSGSGTTLCVCERTDRKWIGCDNDEEYNKLAIKRILKEELRVGCKRDS